MKSHSRPSTLLLAGGLVIDGTGAPGRVADVLIRDGRIQAIGHSLSAPGLPAPGLPAPGVTAPGVTALDLSAPGLTASEVRDVTVLDVTGLVVAPGFVDIHAHSDLTLLSDPRAQSKVRQGVTTEVVGNCGLGVAPLPAGMPPADRHAIRQAVSYLDLDPGVRWTWHDLAGYLTAVAGAAPAVNVATLVGHLVLRAAVCGLDNRPAGAAELSRMCGLLSDALDAGAVGLSTGLVYAPLPYATDNELVALATVTARVGKVFTWHVRSYDDQLLDSVRQAVRVALTTGCRTQISHLCAVGRRNWGAVRRALELVDGANAAGASVGVDIYPYLHGNAPLSQLLPAWAQEGGADVWAPRLADPAVRAGIRDAWKTRPTTWDEITISRTSPADPGTVPSGTVGSGTAGSGTVGSGAVGSGTVGSDARVGRTIQQLADDGGTTGDLVALDLLAELGNGVMMTAGGRSEEDLRAVLEHPAAVVASDGMSLDPDGATGSGIPHPRSYGCFPRYLRRYAGDLPDAIRRCTSAPAARVGLTDRGVLKPGAPADVVVFDPDGIRDRATFTEPHQFADGIELVVVNGSIAVRRGRHTGARAGQVLRS